MNPILRMAVVAILLFGAGMHAEATPAGPDDPGANTVIGLAEGELSQLLDTGTPTDTRKALLAQLDKAARGGDTWSSYVLGSLYRQGGERFEGLLARDPGRALPLLIHAARGGELNAFAKIAETYLDTGDVLEAMAWAQTYSFFLDRTVDGKNSIADGYAAALLKRAYDALPVAEREKIAPRVRALLAKHGPPFELARAKPRTDRPAEEVQVTTRRKVLHSGTSRGKRPEAALVEYLLLIAPDGRVRDIWILDALPTATLGYDLRAVVRTLSFSPEATGADRYAVLPIQFDDGRYSIRRAE